jgi:glycosyltransferase involved in cell wall biosynthesis
MAMDSNQDAQQDVSRSAAAGDRIPKVSVIVPHYRDLGGLALCLAALERQTYPRDDFEIVVGDNNSPEGEAAVAAVIAGRARLVVIREKGAGPARNGAAAVARADILAFTDSDCVPEPAWLSEGLAGLAKHDFVGGKVRVLVDDMARMTSTEAFERVFAFDFKDYILNKGFTGSGNLFCARTLFETVGGFRSVVSEDVEWSHRARGMGFTLGYAPKAVIGHPARRTWPELLIKWKKANAEAYNLLIERRGGRLWWLLRSLALPASAVAHTPKVLASPELETLGQRLAALSTLYRVRWWRFVDALQLLAGRGG